MMIEALTWYSYANLIHLFHAKRLTLCLLFQRGLTLTMTNNEEMIKRNRLDKGSPTTIALLPAWSSRGILWSTRGPGEHFENNTLFITYSGRTPYIYLSLRQSYLLQIKNKPTLQDVLEQPSHLFLWSWSLGNSNQGVRSPKSIRQWHWPNGMRHHELPPLTLPKSQPRLQKV